MILKEIIFISLLTSLHWIENNAANTDTGVTSTNIPGMTSSINSTSSPLMFEIERTVTTGITPSVASSTVIEEKTTPRTAVDDNTQSKNITPTSPFDTSSLETMHQPTLSTKDVSQSSTSNSRMPTSLWMSTTVSRDLPTISKSYATTPSVKSSETVSINFTTDNYDVNSTTTVSTINTQITGTTLPPTSTLPNVSTTPLTRKNNTTNTTDLRISTQTPSLHSSFTDSSAESREPQKGHHNNGGVVFGAIVGAVLGCALISLVGYFLCGKRKSDSFGHQRLYDDARNDPVLRLDNAPETYGANFGDLSYFNPPTTNETAAHDAIQMDDMTPSQPST